MDPHQSKGGHEKSSSIPQTNATPLRILPIGDSITWGLGSSTGNGYRAPLLKLLTGSNSLATMKPRIQYIGSQHSGDMDNNNSEGYGGAVIDQIAEHVYASKTLVQQPNLVLLMAGTNDMILELKVSTAADRLGAMIDSITAACPDVVILVAQVTLIIDPWGDAGSRATDFNATIPAMVEGKRRAGKKVAVVSMDAVTEDDLSDGLHPNDRGYEKMADAWFAGYQNAVKRKWVVDPVVMSPGGSVIGSSPVSKKKLNINWRLKMSLFGTFLLVCWAFIMYVPSGCILEGVNTSSKRAWSVS